MMYDRLTIYRKMSAVKSKGTIPERSMGTAMWKLGLRYRKHYKIRGTPDFVFVSAKIAVFCDGDFWHGNGWRVRGLKSLEEELAGYRKFWSDKIKRNIERDKEVNRILRKNGWLVLRFWESNIRRSPDTCAEKVLKHFQGRIKRKDKSQT